MKKLIISLSIITALLFVNLLVLKRNYMPIKDIEPIEYNVVIDKQLTQEEAIERVNKHLNIKYTLKWRNNGYPAGQALLYVNVVYLQEDMHWIDLIYTLSHELCHIKYYSANETYVEFMTFRELYESDDEVLHFVGEYLITYHCEYRALAKTEYDIGYYILKYLEEKQ